MSVVARMMSGRRTPLTASLAAMLALVAACTSGGVVTTTTGLEPAPTTAGGIDPQGGGFNDHTVSAIESIDAYFGLARTGESDQSAVKFVIPKFESESAVYWMDAGFYTLHDEWYWFRLLNGQPVPGTSTTPADVGAFATVAEIYEWADGASRSQLPLDLRWVQSNTVGPRLYSDEFYRLALDVRPRSLAVGSLVHLPTDDGTTGHWVIELEYGDEPSPAEVVLFFDRLGATLPEEIASELKWVIRSPGQERIARDMSLASSPYHDRIVRYGDLVEPGKTTVYNDGVAAGRLRLVSEGGFQLTDAGDSDILLVEYVPDWLPPANALISDAPQTPLAHVNILARNRGIPNASRAGLLSDPQLRQAARVGAPAIVRATGPDQLEVVLITEEEFSNWRRLGSVETIAVPEVDLASAPVVVDLDTLARQVDNEAEAESWRPVIGGKSVGFLALLNADGVTTPPDPLAITVRPYFEHLNLAQDALDAMLSDRDFLNSGAVRYLMLEGVEDYLLLYPNRDDLDLAERISAEHPRGTVLGDVVLSGGFKKYLRDQPMDQETLSGIVDALEDNFGGYAPTQGLRFRSSSSVEDIEGFNGAGLYDSNTGFFQPEAQTEGDDQKKSIERAIKRTWSSYWSFEAFEERRREQIDHRSGGMGVLVHARFDDPLEINNGVATFTLLPGGTYSLGVNVQAGAVSVTNPDPESSVLPEVIHVSGQLGGAPTVVRRSASTLTDGDVVLGDIALGDLIDQLQAVTLLWRDSVNASLSPGQRVETVTLDFEFKTVANGWPALTDGAPRPQRLVVKQARSLDPGLRQIPEDLRQLEIPRDVLARALVVSRFRCTDSDGSVFERFDVYTDPLIVPDIGFSEDPFTLSVPGSDRGSVECDRTVEFSSPDQFLIELLERGNG